MHIKRLSAPNTWTIHRKEHKWTTRQNPGPHSIKTSVPLASIIKNYLKLATTTKEVKAIVNSAKILVDGKVRKNHKFPVGLMDVIEIPNLKKTYLVVLNKRGKLNLIQYKKSNEKISKIIGKTQLKNKKLQISLYDGKNIIVDDLSYNVNDSIILNLKDNNIIKHIKLEKDSDIYLIGGKYVGNLGKLDSVIKSTTSEDKVRYTLNSKKYETTKKNIMLVPKEFTIENESNEAN